MNPPPRNTFHHVKASTQYKREHKVDYGREQIEILYEDKDIVVINKPTGLLSVPYPGSKARTALDLLEKIMRSRGTFSAGHRPFTVHRLDRDTSGVMMFALNEKMQKKIMDSWHTMVTERLYHAVAEVSRKALPLQDSGLIDDPLAQNAHHVGYVPHDKDDKAKTVAARTHYKILLRGKTHFLFELSLDTGKKNQIRAHLASKGYPLAGDENYRAKTDPFGRLALHARTLEFDHPATGQHMKFEVPEPDEWAEYVKKGDPNPQPPVWSAKNPYNAELKQRQRQMEKALAKKQEEKQNPPRLSAKQKSRMDFIAQGKFKSGKK